MKSITVIMKEIKAAGLIYDPFVTASIISYEAGHFLRNCFYASMTGDSESENQLKEGWLANGKVELSDLITQCRIIAEVYGWNWSNLVDTGEAKLIERIETYKARGVRPTEALLSSMIKGSGSTFYQASPTPPVRKMTRRDGD